MGGIGSGRRNQNGRPTTEERRSLDIRRLQRDGLLHLGSAFNWSWTHCGEKVASIHIQATEQSLIFSYQTQSKEDEWLPKEYHVYLDWTGCNLGGQRAWFRCPAMGCGRRVAILYSGSVFSCRHCSKLAYACQRESLDDRAARRADTIRQRLGWIEGILNGEAGKPKGMHWRTFNQLKREHNAYARRSIAEMRLRFRLINHELDKMGLDLENLYGCA